MRIKNADVNREAWEHINSQGLTIDVQVYPNDDGSSTAYVGSVEKDRFFSGSGFMGKKIFSNNNEAVRDTRAVARAISRETGIPLHPSVPSERLKQVSSHTIGHAELKVMHEMRQRQIQNDWEDSFQGNLYFVIAAIIFGSLFIGGLIFMTWIFSLFG